MTLELVWFFLASLLQPSLDCYPLRIGIAWKYRGAATREIRFGL
jgi:hypothetical protein